MSKLNCMNNSDVYPAAQPAERLRKIVNLIGLLTQKSASSVKQSTVQLCQYLKGKWVHDRDVCNRVNKLRDEQLHKYWFYFQNNRSF